MQAFLQRRVDEDDEAQLEIKNLIDELNGSVHYKNQEHRSAEVIMILEDL